MQVTSGRLMISLLALAVVLPLTACTSSPRSAGGGADVPTDDSVATPELASDVYYDIAREHYPPVDPAALWATGTAAVRTLAEQQPDSAQRQSFLAAVRAVEGRGPSRGDPSQVAERARAGVSELLAANNDTLQLPPGRVVRVFVDASVRACGTNSGVLWPSSVAAVTASRDRKTAGVGLLLTAEDGAVVIVGVVADDLPVQVGDLLLEVDGQRVTTLESAIRQLLGHAGTIATLVVDRGGERLTLRAPRTVSNTFRGIKGYAPGQTVDPDAFLADPEAGIAYVSLMGFQRETAEALRKTLDAVVARGARGVILDLRYSPGGLTAEAAEVMDVFLGAGPAYSIRTALPEPGAVASSFATRDEPNDVRMPVAVIVNRWTSGASELLAGVLRQRGRAIVVGTSSAGTGSAGSVFTLANRAAYLTLATGQFVLADGTPVAKTSPVRPHRAVPNDDPAALALRWSVWRRGADATTPFAFDPAMAEARRALLDTPTAAPPNLGR